VDIIGVDAEQLAAARADSELSEQVVSYPQAFTSTFQFNLKKEPFTDKKVREAFAYAFDRETWCNEVLQGACNPTLAWIPDGIPGYVSTDAYGFDPEKAKAALAASSYGSGANLPEIDVVFIGGDPSEQENMEWVASQYREILDVKLTLVPVEFDAWAEMTGSNETYPSINTLGGWGQDYPDPQNWLSVVYACDTHFAQAIGYCNEEFDGLIEQADQELDPAKRLALYEEANRVLIADAVAIIASNSLGNFLVKPNVTGLSPTPSDFGFPGQFASLLDIDITT
jgi:oligopeptide transport system substrate-binding protein